MKHLIILPIFFSMVVITAMAQPVQPDSIRQAAWQAFKGEHGPDWKIRWNDHTGLPRTMFNGLTKAYTMQPEAAARAFLAEHHHLFSMERDLTGLKHVETTNNRGVYHVTFQQYYKGIPVKSAEYTIGIRENGRIDMANGFYYSNIDISTSPSISDDQAIAIGTSDRKLENALGTSHSAELMILTDEDSGFVLAWKVLIRAEKPSTNWRYLIDAQSGNILDKGNQIVNVTGVGTVYPKHPNNSPLTTVDLYNLDGTGRLNGTYVDVYNSSASRAYSASHDFQYSTSSTHFDEVSLYYHVHSFRDEFIENLDSGNYLFNKLNAYAHNNSECPNNACYNPEDGNLYFSDERDFAKEDKVVYHEYSHAVSHDIESGITNLDGGEEGAVNEGVSDYFAGSFTGRSRIFEYSAPSQDRDMANPDISSYSDYQNDPNYPNVEPHQGGEFFSAILWDLRNGGGITSGQTDFLVYDALWRMSPDPDFIEIRDMMMAADDNAYSGNHNDLIQNTFADWGVGDHVEPPVGPPVVTITGPDNMFEGSSDTFTANVSDGTPPYSYQWYYRHDSEVTWTLVSGATSSTYVHTAGPPPSEYVRVVVTDSYPQTGEDQHFFTIMGFGKVVNKVVPKEFTIRQNYPNPFNPATVIPYGLPERANVTLEVYNILGRRVATLVNKTVGAGLHEASFDGRRLSSGLYLIRFRAEGISGETFSRDMKVQLIK